MEQILQPTPIACRQCNTKVYPQQIPTTTATHIIIEGQWRCPQCGMFNKRGILSKQPKNNEQR